MHCVCHVPIAQHVLSSTCPRSRRRIQPLHRDVKRAHERVQYGLVVLVRDVTAGFASFDTQSRNESAGGGASTATDRVRKRARPLRRMGRPLQRRERRGTI